MFTCIYCLKNEPGVIPSEAHIFPDGMGGLTSTKDTVCDACNNQINREFENTEIVKFAFFQSIWGIRSRRGRIISVPAILRFAGKEVHVSLNEAGEPKTGILDVEKKNDRKAYSIIGPAPWVEVKRQEIIKRDSSIQWHEKDLGGLPPPELVGEFDVNLTRVSLRRLAAKVAFERWAQMFGSTVLSDRQYDTIRNFILTGHEHELSCGVLGDFHLLNGVLNFPIGNHAVVIVGHPQTRLLGAFVAFYSLFYFWVLISKEYYALAAFDDLLLENPQEKEIRTPKLRYGTGDLFVQWTVIENAYRIDPYTIVRVAIEHAIKKFQVAADAFYASREQLNI